MSEFRVTITFTQDAIAKHLFGDKKDKKVMHDAIDEWIYRLKSMSEIEDKDAILCMTMRFAENDEEIADEFFDFTPEKGLFDED